MLAAYRRFRERRRRHRTIESIAEIPSDGIAGSLESSSIAESSPNREEFIANLNAIDFSRRPTVHVWGEQFIIDRLPSELTPFQYLQTLYWKRHQSWPSDTSHLTVEYADSAPSASLSYTR